MRTKLLLSLLALSIVLSIPSLLRIPRVLPFLDPEVRAAAPQALEMLRSQGFWLVNIDIHDIEAREGQICFLWEHRYSSRKGRAPAAIITTCTHAPPA